jgi:uncharacterized membrane protein YeaQ/YmgE (transglycosylase-associated protein family)
MTLIVLGVISGAIGAAIGSRRGRVGGGFLLGMFLGIVGWIIVALMSPTAEYEARRSAQIAALVPRPPVRGSQRDRPCPWCGEDIKKIARICRFCNRDVATPIDR